MPMDRIPDPFALKQIKRIGRGTLFGITIGFVSGLGAFNKKLNNLCLASYIPCSVEDSRIHSKRRQ
ncbi:MAG: hypothetical protein A4E58_01407 [Syntrophorhabdus sp. PtaB.Bin006]|nr:MAG: hypothetical protein A4E58_01407 [Syntrophorhabdus sp. PtaB.Bin006]